MRGYSHSSTKVLFPCCTCTCQYIFKNLYTIKLLKDRPVSVCKVKCLNLRRNARNLDWLSVPIHRSFLRDRHHCTKRSTPLQLPPVCFTLQKQDVSFDVIIGIYFTPYFTPVSNVVNLCFYNPEPTIVCLFSTCYKCVQSFVAYIAFWWFNESLRFRAGLPFNERSLIPDTRPMAIKTELVRILFT